MPSLKYALAGCLISVFLSPAVAAEKPRLSEPYQSGFDRVWEQADAGKSPTSPCASVVGTAVGHMGVPDATAESKKDALEALHACYVIAAAHYIQRNLDAVESGEGSCVGMIAGMSVHRGSLGGFVSDAGVDREDYDREIAVAVGDRVHRVCEGAATVILGQ